MDTMAMPNAFEPRFIYALYPRQSDMALRRNLQRHSGHLQHSNSEIHSNPNPLPGDFVHSVTVSASDQIVVISNRLLFSWSCGKLDVAVRLHEECVAESFFPPRVEQGGLPRKSAFLPSHRFNDWKHRSSGVCSYVNP